MELNYQYATPSMCLQQEDHVTLGLSPDLTRDEKVSFVGRLKHPLVFRDAMLMLREIVISDTKIKKKDYSDFFAWFNQELDRRMVKKEEFLVGVRTQLKDEIIDLITQLEKAEKDISNVKLKIFNTRNNIDKFTKWENYYKLERQFWKYINHRDPSLWWVLDPVITVHPDQVSFEAFSLDESVYGCLSVNMDEFEVKGTPKLGTTNIDFSLKLAKEIERFRTYNEVELSINPEGFTVDTGVTPEYVEKKIDLPESWIKGFNQVSAAASLKAFEIELQPVDIYDICSFLRRNKAHKSPRSMKWIFEPNKHIRIVFEPWEKEIELSTIYKGKRTHVERIWGRRRWLIMEKIIPISKSFRLRLFGFGMPQFLIADLGLMTMTIGFTSWSANDWVKGTSFNIMAGLIGEGDPKIKSQLKEHRIMSIKDLKNILKSFSEEKIKGGIGILLRKGEAYYDPIIEAFRYRQLLNVPLPQELYQITSMERDVASIIKETEEKFQLELDKTLKTITSSEFHESSRRMQRYGRYRTVQKIYNTKIVFDQDRQITKVDCGCKTFKKGPRNISSPCKHVLAVYITASKYLDLTLDSNNKYQISDLEELKGNDK